MDGQSSPATHFQHAIFQELLRAVLEHRRTLTRAEAAQLLEQMLAGAGTSPEQDMRMAAVLGGMAARGETPEELAGFVDALRARAVPLPLTDSEREVLVDTCGTGGDAAGTFNISTGAALVAAAAGAIVAKHGNRAVTSRAGSADVLEALGIPVDLSPESAAGALREHGFAFLAAPSYHPAMRAVLPLRRALGVRTAFNLLGPLANPAGARAQVVGVYSAKAVPTVAQALALLGVRHAMVVHGMGLDELTTTGPSLIGEVLGAETQFGNVGPELFGLPAAPAEALRGGSAAENAAILEQVFAGVPGPARDVVVMNAAAVLLVAGEADTLLDAAALAADALGTGKVRQLVRALAAQPPSRG